MEVLVALSLMGLVFLLASEQIGVFARGWFLMREVRSDLTLAREIDVVLIGFANEVENLVAIEAAGGQTIISSIDQSLRLDEQANQLVWVRQTPVTIHLPEPEIGWNLIFNDAERQIIMRDGEQIIAIAQLEHRISLPCMFDAISRRCLSTEAL